MQHPRGITKPAGIHGHIHDLALDLGRLPGVGILQEKRPAAIGARATPVALLAFGRRAMSHNICTLAVRTVQHLCNHCGSLSHRWFWSAPILRQYNRSTALKHLPQAICRRTRRPTSVGTIRRSRWPGRLIGIPSIIRSRDCISTATHADDMARNISERR